MSDIHIPNHLIDAARNGRVVPFFGAGLPANLDMPLWGQLVRRIGKELGFDPPELIESLGDPMQVAQFFVQQQRGKGPLTHLLGEVLRVPPATQGDWRGYEALVALNPDIVYTTNFDMSIEEFYGRQGLPYRTVAEITHMRERLDDETLVVHFHGCVKHPDSIVVAEDDYMERLGLQSPLDIRFRADLQENTFVFLGYSLQDFNLRFIWHQLQRQLVPLRSAYGAAYTSYFVTHRRNDVFRSIMGPKGLEIIEVDFEDVRDVIPSFLSTLAGAL